MVVFQSALPRRERPCHLRHTLKRFAISIHAPVKGATFIPFTHIIRFSISIHAPAKGATMSLRKNILNLYISIHAPAKGATGSG